MICLSIDSFLFCHLLSDLIRELQSLNSLIQERLAVIIGTSYVTVSSWEASLTHPFKLRA
jgi:DNA-binding transcriptional regulator YiaG